MRRLGLDIGEKRVGVAVSDPLGRVATPLTTLDSVALAGDRSCIGAIVDEYEIGELVIGLPVSLSGAEGPQAAAIRETGERLAADLELPVVFQDERLSSRQARRDMRAAGTSARKSRGSVDVVAATILLQAYLDARSGDG